MSGSSVSEVLRRTEGWLELGCPDEAMMELEALPDVMHATREVLKLKCRAHHLAENWRELLALAATCSQYFPRETMFVTECDFARTKLEEASISYFKPSGTRTYTRSWRD